MPATTNPRKAQPRHRSLIHTVKPSGFDLVPTRERVGNPPTLRDYAKVEFKPWKPDPSGQISPSKKTMDSLGVTARVAHAVMMQTREQLIALHGKLDHELADEMMTDLADGLEHFKAIGAMVETAYQRLLMAACARYAQGGKFPRRKVSERRRA